MSATGASSIRARAEALAALVDELLEEIATGPDASLLRIERSLSTLEYEWVFIDEPEQREVYGSYVDELYERAIARGLCAQDWLDDAARRFVLDRCPICDGTAIDSNAESNRIACACFSARPVSVERVLRMLALPPSMIVAQEHAARSRWPHVAGVVYVTRFESVEHVVSERETASEWVARPDPPMIGVRWPRIVTL